MADEHIFSAAPSGHALTITMDTKALVVDRVVVLGSLPGAKVTATDDQGRTADYVRVLVGDDVKALQGDRFRNGDCLCVRIGDRSVVCRYQRFTHRVHDSSRGSWAARSGAYADPPVEVYTIPEGAVVAQVPGPFEAQLPREGEDMYGAVTWPPTYWRGVHLARLWTVTAGGKVVQDRRTTYVPVF